MWCAGHFFKDVEANSSAQSAGIKKNDRLVAVNGEEVENLSHEQVVSLIKKSGSTCCFLVVDKFTDQMYKLVSGSPAGLPKHSLQVFFVTMPFCLSQGNVSPMLFYDTLNDHSLPPSYSEALYLPSRAKPSTPEAEKTEELEPKLCRMQKISGTFGFHLNCIQGIDEHFLSEVRHMKTTQRTAKFVTPQVFFTGAEGRSS